MASGYTMCWAAKWLDNDEIMFDSVYHSRPKSMIKRIHTLLDEADAVVHYNGQKFDIPTLNKEFLLHGLPPPAPYKQIDLLRTARKQFRFPSNKLDYIAQTLGLGEKTQHKGHELWVECMAKLPEAWETMQEYNINDVILLEKVYYKLLPWIKGHANHSLHDSVGTVCPNCGGVHYQRRGIAFTIGGSYQRYKCNDCGTWFRNTKNLGKRPEAKHVAI